tara:strand:- start:392 stop:721 length:330 start_codon:yes stop_codon:yes gene_type:complete
MSIQNLESWDANGSPIEETQGEVDAFFIEEGVPLPEDVRGTQTRYPFSKMRIGDSIFIRMKEGDDSKRMKNRLSQATRTFGKKQQPEMHFVLRYRLENEISGVRVWRKD